MVERKCACTPTREEMMLRQVWSNAFSTLPWDDAFAIDESFAYEIRHQIAGSADVAAALDCWRNKMLAAIDEVVARYKYSEHGGRAA